MDFTAALRKAVNDPNYKKRAFSGSYFSPGQEFSRKERVAAWAVAEALGACRMFGIDTQDLVDKLSLSGIVAALQICIEKVGTLCSFLENLTKDQDRALNILRSGEIILMRFAIQYGYIAILDSLEKEESTDKSIDSSVYEEFNKLMEAWSPMDEIFRGKIGTISSMVNRELLISYLTLLKGQPLPWWFKEIVQEWLKKKR
jgi:hypothetical protein